MHDVAELLLYDVLRVQLKIFESDKKYENAPRVLRGAGVYFNISFHYQLKADLGT